MNKIFAYLSAALLLAGCQALSLEPGKVYHTECAKAFETRAHSGGMDREELIHLKYTSAGLLVTDEWGDYNCAIEEMGVQAKLEIQGTEIYLRFWVDPPLANCICPIEEVKYLVRGLERGKEYTLYLNGLIPIQFKYTPQLDLRVEAVDISTNPD